MLCFVLSTITFDVYFFKTNWYKLFSWMSKSTRSSSWTSGATSLWCTPWFYFLINPDTIYKIYTHFFKTNLLKLVSWMSELSRSYSRTSRATSWWCTEEFYIPINLNILPIFFSFLVKTSWYKLVLWMSDPTRLQEQYHDSVQHQSVSMSTYN